MPETPDRKEGDNLSMQHDHDFTPSQQTYDFSGITFPSRLTAPLAITHVTVVPMDTKRLLPDSTVIIENGIIRVIGPASTIDTANISCIDGRGKYLMPGLADMHVHYGDPGEAALFLANGVTLVRNMWGQGWHLSLENTIQQEQFPGPHIVTTSPIIDGASAKGRPVHPGSIVLTDPDEAALLVERYAEQGYQQIKVYSLLQPAVLYALGQAARRVGLRMVGHCPVAMTFEEAIAAGMTCFEHLSSIGNGHLLPDAPPLKAHPGSAEGVLHYARYMDFTAICRLARQMAEQQIWNCPTLIVWQAMGIEPSVALTDPMLQYENPRMRSNWSYNQRTKFLRSPDWAETSRLLNETNMHILSILHEEGVPLLLGTDTTNPYVFQGFSTHQELANLVQAGLTPYEALRCGTIDAARFLSETDQWGTIAEGKRADLLLLQTNPLQDVSAIRALEAVFVNGYHLSHHDLTALPTQRAAAIQNISTLIPTVLDAPSKDSVILEEGTWCEDVNGRQADRLTYRYQRLPDDTLLFEECYAITNRLQRWRVRLWMEPGGILLKGERRIESLGGTALATCERVQPGAYIVEQRTPNGYTSRAQLEATALMVGPQLAISVMPCLLATRTPGEEVRYSTLHLNNDHHGAQIVPMKFSPPSEDFVEPGLNEGIWWQIVTEMPTFPLTHSYQLDNDGTFKCLHYRGAIWTQVKTGNESGC